MSRQFIQKSSLPGLFIASSIITGILATPAVGMGDDAQASSDSSVVSTTCLTTISGSNKLKELYQKRVELFYYRDASTIAKLINALPLQHKGCASILPLRSLTGKLTGTEEETAGGEGVGSGGGNVVILSGEQEFINEAYRLIARLDLPLAGIELQLLGIQISSEHPEKLARVMNDVRDEISLTQQLVRDVSSNFKAFTQTRLRDPETYIQPGFLEISAALGSQVELSGSRKLSIFDVSLVGYISKNPQDYYQSLYEHFMKLVQDDERYHPYLQAMRRKNRPVFERFFRERGLKPKCEAPNNRRSPCDKWVWEETSPGIVKILSIVHQRSALEFNFEYADFINNPREFNPKRLQYSSDVLNSILQSTASSFQKDIDDFLIRPTVENIQRRVRQERRVSFAQVGRTTISTLSGVPTQVKSEAFSSVRFNNQEPASITELLKRASMIDTEVAKFIPSVPLPGDASKTIPIVQAGPLPISKAIGLLIAANEDRSKPVTLQTGTNLTFTPGVLRDLSSAELNIDLSVTSPALTSTATGSNDDPDLSDVDGGQGGTEAGALNFSRIGKHSIKTSVYTQASDFFDLSTFTSQATLSGGRGYFPIVGQLWKAIFGNTPVLGRLFSFQKNSQNVLHESLLLTNSSIKPTPLGIGFIYRNRGFSSAILDEEGKPYNPYFEGNFCKTKAALNYYIADLEGSNSTQDDDVPIVKTSIFGSGEFDTMEYLNNEVFKTFGAARLLSPQDSERCPNSISNASLQ